MAIIQQANAVFYHPLDDSTESLQTQAWTPSGAVFGPGKVSLAMTPLGVDPIIGAAAAVGTDAAYLSAARISATRFVVAYRDNPDGGRGKARVGTVSGTDVTLGATTEFLTSAANSIAVAVLGVTSFVVAYVDEADSSHGTAKVGTVSGADITFGAETEFLGGFAAGHVSAAALDASRFVVAYQDGVDSGHGTAKVGTVSGADITFGAEAEFLSAAVATDTSVAALDASKFVVTWTVNTVDSGKARIGTVSGTSILFGTEAEYLAAGGDGAGAAVALSDTAFVVAYRDGNDSNHGTAKAGTVSGTDITFGADIEFWAGGAATQISAAKLSSTTFAVTYQGGTNGSATTRVGTVSGTDITFGAEADFETIGSAASTATAAMNSGRYVGVYTVSAVGSARTASLVADASLAGTGAPYATAVGAARLAFSLWSRTPADIEAAAAPTVTGPITEGSTVVAGTSTEADGASIQVYVNGTPSGTPATVSGGAWTKPGLSPLGGGWSVWATASVAGKLVSDPSSTVLVTALLGASKLVGVGWNGGAQSGANSSLRMAKLDATHILMTYHRYQSGGGDVASNRARVGVVSGMDITLGAEVLLPGNNSNHQGLAGLTATTAIQVDNASAYVLTVSGTDVTAGAPFAVPSGGVSGGADDRVTLDAHELSSTSFVVAWYGSSGLTAVVGAMAGAVITWGAATTGVVPDVANQLDLAVLSPTKVVIAYQVNTNPWDCKVVAGDVTFLTLSWGTPFVYETGANNSGGVGVTGLDSSKFVVTVGGSGGSGNVKARIGTVAGFDITLGGLHTVTMAAAQYWQPHVAALSPTKFLVQYTTQGAGVTDGRYSRAGTVSGTSITWGDIVAHHMTEWGLFTQSAGSIVAPVAMDSTRAAMFWQDGRTETGNYPNYNSRVRMREVL